MVMLPHRASTRRRREWVSAELATLSSHTAASLWVSNISWDQFITTVQLTAFDHKGTYIWYFFLCYIYAGYWFYDPVLKWYLLHWKPRGITAGPPGSWTPREVLVPSFEKLCSFFKPSLIQEVLLDQPQPLPPNSDHIQSTPHRWLFHLTCVYFLPISQAGMGILEGKISPFSNLRTVTNVLDSYGLTRNTGSITFYCCGSCICGNWIPLSGDSQLLCSWFYLLTRDGSLFICNWVTPLVQKELLLLQLSCFSRVWIYATP